MTRNEFIKKMESLGYKVELDADELLVSDKKKYIHAVISEVARFMVDTDFPHYHDGKWEEVERMIDEEAYDIIHEYARTPIKERTKEKYFLVVGNGLVYKESVGSNHIFSKRRNVFDRVNGKVFENEEECRELAKDLGGKVVVATHYLNSIKAKEKSQWHFMSVDGESKMIAIEIAND